MNIRERFRKVRKRLGLKQAEIGKVLDLSQDAISAIETGRNKPTLDVLSVLYNNYDVNIEWMLTGNGTMFLNGIGEDEESTEKKQAAVYIPVIGAKVPPEYGKVFENVKIEIDEYFPLSGKVLSTFPTEKIKAFKIASDILYPFLSSGDYVVFVEEFRPKTDGIYIVNKSGVLSAQRIVYRTDGSLKLSPDNTKYPPEEISSKDADKVNISGKVVSKLQSIL